MISYYNFKKFSSFDLLSCLVLFHSFFFWSISFYWILSSNSLFTFLLLHFKDRAIFDIMLIQHLLSFSLVIFADSSLTDISSEKVLWSKKDISIASKNLTSLLASSAEWAHVHDTACSNNSLTRNCWVSDYNIAIDFNIKWSTTDKIVFISRSMKKIIILCWLSCNDSIIWK